MTKPSPNKLAFPLLVVMALLPLAFAEEKVAGEANDELAALAVGTREAVVVVDDGPWGAVGVFISADGLALLHLQALMGKDTPKVLVAGGKKPKFGKILGVFPELELALVKIEHRPKTWLRLAPVEPGVGETVALVTLKHRDQWLGKVPPVIGRVLAKRSGTTANLREPRFVRSLSLGAGLSSSQNVALGPGCFAIDRNGRLVAFLSGRRRTGFQTMIHLAPVVALGRKIEELAEGGIDLGHPLPLKHNPIDPASIDPDFHPLGMAINLGDLHEAQRLLDNLDRRHPGSFLLKLKRLSLIMAMAFGNQGVPIPQALKPAPQDPVAFQVAAHEVRAFIFQEREQHKEAARELEAAIKLSPDDYPEPRQRLGGLRASQGRFDDAEKLLREVYPLSSDSIPFVELLERILLDQGKGNEAQKMSERVFELEEIYRRR